MVAHLKIVISVYCYDRNVISSGSFVQFYGFEPLNDKQVRFRRGTALCATLL
jgi:hypothetical protein